MYKNEKSNARAKEAVSSLSHVLFCVTLNQ